MASKVRVSKAFAAMREIGIPAEKVKPVLKNLWKLYDKNWEMIEAENYRALADAIFQYEDDKVQQVEDIDEDPLLEVEDPEPPLKRSRFRGQEASLLAENLSPSSGEILLKKPKIEEHLIGTSPKGNRVEQSQLLFSGQRPEGEAVGPEFHLGNKRKEPSAHVSRIRVESMEKSLEEIPLSSQAFSGKEGEDQSCPSPRGNIAESDSVTPQAHYVNKGKRPIHSQFVCREKKVVSKRSSSDISFKEPNVERGIVHLPKGSSHHPVALLKPKTEPFTDGLPQIEAPLAMIHPHNSTRSRDEDQICKDCNSAGNDSSSKHEGQERIIAENANGKHGSEGVSNPASNAGTSFKPADIPNLSSADFEIASSPLGEVKISLRCNYVRVGSNFHMPNLETVVKKVEDKYFKQFKIIEPRFSLMKVMKEFCKCFLEVGTNSFDGSSSNGSPSTCSPSAMVLPKVPRLVPMPGLSMFLRNVQPNSKLLDIKFGGKDRKKDSEIPQSTESRSLVVFGQERSSFDNRRTLHDVNDISKGEETIGISFINEVSSEHPPPFYYIPQNIVYQNAYINFSLARIGDDNCCSTCFGDCVSSSIPCACARETGGEFAYTLEGLVNEKFLNECISVSRNPHHPRLFCSKDCPLEQIKNEELPDKCKGHLVRKFIKECWSKCGCSKQCGNRVVQRGITCNLQVFLEREDKGWGLRTLEELPRGAFVCEYVGEILTNTELYERNERSTGNERHTYPVLLDADWGSEGFLKDDEALCLDGTSYGNVARFINHRCGDANLVEIPVEIETPDHHYYHIGFFTTRKVDASEELTWDYGINFDDHNHPIKAFKCLCGSDGCRDKNDANGTKSRSRALVLC